MDLVALARSGLVLVRHLDDNGHAIGDSVVSMTDVPEVCLATQPHPTSPCGACHTNLWRLDRGTGTTWVCGRCFP